MTSINNYFELKLTNNHTGYIKLNNERKIKLYVDKVYPELFNRQHHCFLLKSNVLNNDKQVFIFIFSNTLSNRSVSFSIAIRENTKLSIICNDLCSDDYDYNVDRLSDTETLYYATLTDELLFKVKNYTYERSYMGDNNLSLFINHSIEEFNIHHETTEFLLQQELRQSVIDDEQKTEQVEIKKCNRKFILLPKHLYNDLYKSTVECPCCLDNIHRDKFEMTICGHPICNDCLYNLPNSKCPTCRSNIE